MIVPSPGGSVGRPSRASWGWPPKRKGRSRSRWSRREIIELRLWPDQSRQINDLPPAEVLAKDSIGIRSRGVTSDMGNLLRGREHRAEGLERPRALLPRVLGAEA